MDTTLKLPVGIEDFQEIRRLGFYYIDKTKLIEQLLEQWGKVNLFTRPRRFGKTLNMSMLRCFFEIGTDKTLFDNLYISKRKDWIDGITLSGGEPFCQIYQCALIAEKAHQMGLSVWCYTGYLFEDLYRQGIELLKHIDVLVDGPFVQSEKSLELDFRGSRNQRVIDIPESLKEGVAILKQT